MKINLIPSQGTNILVSRSEDPNAMQVPVVWMLDPSIKKTEWSKVNAHLSLLRYYQIEDEKFLRLVRLMQMQWRTTTQCLDGTRRCWTRPYEELGLTGPRGDINPSAPDIIWLRPGEID